MRKVLGHGRFFGSTAHAADVGGFALAEIGADPILDVEWHTHSTAHFILVTSGDYITTARGAFEHRSPALVYNPPGTAHRDCFRSVDGRADGRFMSIGIADNRMGGILSGVQLPSDPLVVSDSYSLSLAFRLRKEVMSWHEASQLTAEGLCLELSACVAERGMVASRHVPPWLAAARELLHDRLSGPVTMGDIATAAGVHPVHLSRVFRKHFGCAPATYLRRCRLAHAASLLADTTVPLVSVALVSGFGDQSHFTNAFRSMFSVAPGAYRRIAQA
ncbi:MAG: AraC family transcriptional regulator [Gemmatimonadota bacterium]|nr:AraC family transcriptional regulator [Gemmatimonadota bacterium]